MWRRQKKSHLMTLTRTSPESLTLLTAGWSTAQCHVLSNSNTQLKLGDGERKTGWGALLCLGHTGELMLQVPCLLPRICGGIMTRAPVY